MPVPCTALLDREPHIWAPSLTAKHLPAECYGKVMSTKRNINVCALTGSFHLEAYSYLELSRALPSGGTALRQRAIRL